MKKNKNPVKSVLKVLFVSVIVIVTFAIFIGVVANNLSKTTTNGNSITYLIKTETKANEEEAKDIISILDKVGITEKDLISIKADNSLNDLEGNNSKGYRISSFGVDSIIMYLVDNKVYSIRYADKDYYKDNQVLRNFKDNTMTDKDQDTYMLLSQEAVKEILKSPTTAKFPNLNSWEFGKEDGIIKTHSYVDSQNSYGAIIRAEFQVTFDKNGNITSLILDNTEYIK